MLIERIRELPIEIIKHISSYIIYNDITYIKKKYNITWKKRHKHLKLMYDDYIEYS